MADTSLGFRYRGRQSGGQATIQNLTCANTATYSAGDTVTISSGQVALGATAATTFVGLCLETKSATAGSTKVRVIVDSDIILGVYDNNARLKGATLDVAGATGAQTVAASSNKEFVVWETKSNNIDETLVTFNVGKHIGNKAL